MSFRLNLPVDIERPDDDLTTSEALTIQVAYVGGKWRGLCQDPPIATLMHDTLEEALVAAVKEIRKEWRAEVPRE